MDPPSYLSLTSRGLLALPHDVRKRHRLDEPGAQVALIERDDGVIELHPQAAIPAGQAGFWTRSWLAGEREVDEHVARGEQTVFDGPDALVAHLETLGSD